MWLSGVLTTAVFVPLVAYLAAPQCTRTEQSTVDAETASAATEKVDVPAPEAPLQKRRAPGSRVLLELPEAFAADPTFGGFAREGTMSSVMVTASPAPFDASELEGLDAEGFAENGVQDAKVARVSHEGKDARWMEGTQVAPNGQTVAKFMLAFGDDTTTVFVVGAADSGDEEIIRHAVRTATIDPEQEPDVDAELSFSVDDAKGLVRIEQPLGGMVGFTPNGKIGDKNPGAPYLLVGPSLAPAEIPDPIQFARARLLALPHHEGAEIEREEEIEIGGLSAVRVTATFERDGQKIASVLTLLPLGEAGYLLSAGKVAAKQRAKYFPIFERITSTMRAK